MTDEDSTTEEQPPQSVGVNLGPVEAVATTPVRATPFHFGADESEE